MLLPVQEIYSDKGGNVKTVSKNFYITPITPQNPGPLNTVAKLPVFLLMGHTSVNECFHMLYSILILRDSILIKQRF